MDYKCVTAARPDSLQRIRNPTGDPLGTYNLKVWAANQAGPGRSWKDLGFYVESNVEPGKGFLQKRIMLELRF